MATDVVYLVNPTPANITVNGNTINSLAIAQFTLTDSTTDLYKFVAEGCIAAPAAMTNGTGNVTDVLDNLTSLVQKGAFILGKMVHVLQSAGTDTFGDEGI